MARKKQRVFPNNIEAPKGVLMDSKSITTPHDSLSIKDMIQRHVQGLLDPSQYMDGNYDPDNIDHESDVQHRSQKTLLDALDYAYENGMTRDEVQNFIDSATYEEPKETNESEPEEPNQDGD